MIAKLLLSFFIFSAFSLSIIAQYNIVKFESELNETDGIVIFDSNNEFAAIFYRQDPISGIFNQYLYKFSNDGDTLFSKQFIKQDTLINLETIIQCNTNPVEYLLYANAYKCGDDKRKTFSIFYKINSDFEIVWQKVYQLRPLSILSSWGAYSQLLLKKDNDFLFSTNIGPEGNLLFFDMTENGDSLNYRIYEGDSAGLLLSDVIYNYDSSAYIAFTRDAHGDTTLRRAQAITIDTNLNQIKVNYFPEYFFDGIIGKLLPSGNLITGGLYIEISIEKLAINMAAYKFDTSFNYMGNSFIGNPDFDIRKDNGFVSMDFYDPNSVYVAGTFDEDIGVWIEHPSWIIIGKVDSSMNLVTEKYIGGDAYYRFNTITATNDGGVLIGATRYDYQTQDHEHDVYYYRFDSIEMTVSVDEEKGGQIIQNAIIYPNPAKNHFFLRTFETDSELYVFDLSGNKVLSQTIRERITQVEIENIVSGIYIWRLVKNSKQIESGKILITN
jgi:hypothetical protein